MEDTVMAESANSIKPIHTILLDTSPILLNTPPISTLLANCETLVTTQSVIDEIRGEEARNRFETLYRPFVEIRSPKVESVKFVREFARRTGDSGVLSATDFEILALAYDLECERNGGDWRLRNAPGQKRLNGSPPEKEIQQTTQTDPVDENVEDVNSLQQQLTDLTLREVQSATVPPISPSEPAISSEIREADDLEKTGKDGNQETVEGIETLRTESIEGSDSDEGWITPSNIKKHRAKDEAGANETRSETKFMQVATMTGDFAMQNVLLQINLNLLSTKTCKRVGNIKQMILRCHGCFNTTKEMSKQFCPRCGRPTLTRVTCTTNDKGEVKLHLKANHQWNNRGNIFSVPKPVSGSANQKWKGPNQGGGQRGWGSDLILAEDQKEYVRAVSSQQRAKKKDLMDEDTLPSIISGDRGQRNGGRIQVGGGRNINSRKR